MLPAFGDRLRLEGPGTRGAIKSASPPRRRALRSSRSSLANMIYHWNQNAYTYWNMGRLGGEGMLSVLPQEWQR